MTFIIMPCRKNTVTLNYYLQIQGIYEDLYNSESLQDLFDNANYKEDSPYYFTYNKKVIEKMKDETAVSPISEFVGLKSKMYSFRLDSGKTTKKCKGIVRNVVKKI